MIVFFGVLAYRDIDSQTEPKLETGDGLKSPFIYLYVISAFLIAHSVKKFVVEMVVGFRNN
jgi:hypothetical protein